MVFYSALPLISIINEDQSWRDLENIPQINIAFPNGQFDNLILERFYASAESRKAGKPHCNFIGHLENEPTACAAVTGCYGVDNVEFTIKSRHLLSSNSIVMDPNGNLKEILDEDEEELLYDYIQEDDDDEEIDVDDYSSEQRMLTTRPEGMPEKSKLTFKVCM